MVVINIASQRTARRRRRLAEANAEIERQAGSGDYAPLFLCGVDRRDQQAVNIVFGSDAMARLWGYRWAGHRAGDRQ
jgi:hypothetical protein